MRALPPRVSIGLPVYNGKNTSQCSDNASTGSGSDLLAAVRV
jgi:hypothetical protein